MMLSAVACSTMGGPWSDEPDASIAVNGYDPAGRRRRAGGTRSYVLVTPTAGNALPSLLRQGRQKQGTRCRGCTERELVHQGEEVAVGLRTDVDEHDRRSALRGHDAHQSLAQGEVENTVSDGVRRDARIGRESSAADVTARHGHAAR